MSSDAPAAGQIHLHIDGPLAWLAIDNPSKRNALSFDMWASLPGLIDQAQADPDVRAIVLHGADGKAFASGSDISQFGERRNTPEGVALYNQTVEQAIAALGHASLPTIACIEGVCFGGGVALAIHCDLRYATPGSRFCIPAGRLGLAYHPDWLRRLRDLTGPSAAKEMLFTACTWDAAQAQHRGLIDHIVDDRDAVRAQGEAIATLAPLTMRAAKLAIDDRSADTVRQAADACFHSQDYAEGRAAFAEKRAPRFTGR